MMSWRHLAGLDQLFLWPRIHPGPSSSKNKTQTSTFKLEDSTCCRQWTPSYLGTVGSMPASGIRAAREQEQTHSVAPTGLSLGPSVWTRSHGKACQASSSPLGQQFPSRKTSAPFTLVTKDPHRHPEQASSPEHFSGHQVITPTPDYIVPTLLWKTKCKTDQSEASLGEDRGYCLANPLILEPNPYRALWF